MQIFRKNAKFSSRQNIYFVFGGTGCMLKSDKNIGHCTVVLNICGSSVWNLIATRLQAGWSGARIPAGSSDFPLLRNVCNGSGAYSAHRSGVTRVWCLCDRASVVQRCEKQDATTFSFINLFKLAQHVSGDKFAHPQEHFLTVYTAFGTMHRHCCRQAAVSVHCTKSCIYSQKMCSWGWANLSPETCRAELNKLIKEKVVASCWLFTTLY
jgi:hypothetical protein